jgi:hypothetical protein
MGEEALCLIADDLAALEQTANVCERRIMAEEKVPIAEKIISLSDSDASFIVKGGWNTVVGYRPQLARAVGAALSPRWCSLRATLLTAGTLLRWFRRG